MICKSHFGCRSGVSTSDALFLARRFINKATAQRVGKLVMLAPDVAKAFDSISPSALIRTLHRFNISQHFIVMIHAIYCSRMFFVHDQQHSSDVENIHLNINQSCPLFPILFVIMMIVSISDAHDDLIAAISDEAQDVHETLICT